MSRKLFVLMAGAALTCAANTYAHHSQVAVYRTNDEQKIEGALVAVLVRSPHSWVHVEAKDEKGELKRYAVSDGKRAAASNR